MTLRAKRTSASLLVAAVLGGAGVAVALVLSGDAAAVDDKTVFCSEYVPNAQAESNYAKWLTQNAGEKSRWEPFRDAICAGQSPVSPSMTTAKGRALVAAGKMALPESSPPPTTTTTTTTSTTTTTEPPPPSSSHPYNGFWTRPIPASPVIDPASASIIPFWVGYAIVNPNLATNAGYGVALATSSAGDPLYTVAPSPSGRVHRLDNPIRIPLGTTPATGSDHHLSIIDPANGRIHDMYDAVFNGSAWVMGGGMSTSMGTNGDIGVFNAFWGANAAKTPNVAGLVRPEEIAAGRIDHALQFGNPKIGQGAPRFPARSNVPTAPNSDTRYIVEGTWLQLNPSFDVSAQTWAPWVKIIARAMQQYGMILRDNSGALAIYAEDTRNRGGNTLWTNVGVTGTYPAFPANFPWSQMRVLSPPAP